MVVTQALATPEIGAVAWISGLFHVEQTNEDRINPAESADSASVENHVNNWTFNSKRALILGTATKQICFECSTWNAALWATPFLNSIMERLGVTRPTQRYLAIY